MRKPIYLLFILGLVAIMACEEVYTPKPKGYNRIDLPEHNYQVLPDTFPYAFQFSTLAKLVSAQSDYSERYWVTLDYTDFEAIVQLTYKDLQDPNIETDILLNEAFELTKQHQVKAYSIEESLVGMPNGQVASVAELEGEVPTQFQFYTSDSTHHFFRGALYFNTAMKNDSLSPVIEFIKTDIMHMLNTFEWKY
jgi:gliding motility-associated lipoprotein GldD